MYKYFKHKEINYYLWDKCIETSKTGTIYSTSWYLNNTSLAWDAIIKNENDNYISVIPLPFKIVLGLKILYNPVLTHQLGLFSIHPLTENDYKEIYHLIKKHFKYISSYNFHIQNSIDLNFRFFDFTTIIYTSYHLNLAKPYSEIWGGLSKDRIANISKSQKYHQKVEESSNIEDVLQLFKENVEGKIYGGVDKNGYEAFVRLFKKSRNFSKLYIIKDEQGELIYGCWIFIYRGKIIKFLNSGNEEGRKRNCDSFFMNYLIKNYSGKDLILDFERRSSEGVNKYKESYGPETVNYMSIRYNNLPFILNKIQVIRQLYYRIKRQYFGHL